MAVGGTIATCLAVLMCDFHCGIQLSYEVHIGVVMVASTSGMFTSEGRRGNDLCSHACTNVCTQYVQHCDVKSSTT